MESEKEPLAYCDLTLCSRGPMAKPGSVSQGAMMASFELNVDIAPLFPFINALAERAELYERPKMIRFPLDQTFCVLYPTHGLATPFGGRTQAMAFMERLFAFLNDTHRRSEKIKPKHRTFRRVSVIEILRLLPQNNCRECGFVSCMAFAANLSQQQTLPDQCPHMEFPLSTQADYPVYDSDGNIRSTVRIEIDTVQTFRALQRRSGRLEEQLNSLLQDREQAKMEANASLPTRLTQRELEVLRLLSEGASNVEISHLLDNISPHTVKSHVIHLFNKLGVDNRIQAAVWATRHHLFEVLNR